MSKTAEEILRDRVDIVTGHPLNPWKHIIRDAMREFAAQEVEEYKDRLKAELAGEWGLNDDHLNLSALLKIEKLIDTVK